MIRLKNEKGAITMITLITIIFMVSFLMTSYILTSNKVKTQKEILNETKELYKPKSTMEEIYNSYFTNDNIIPIYTVEQLLAIGSDEKINVNEKIYTFSNTEDTTYLLNEDLEFSAKELGLQSDWVPIYENTEFLGNFDWNGHTIKVTTLSGDIKTYNGRYQNTVIGNPAILTNSIKGSLVDYKIYGNSVQNGTPSVTEPVEIQSVGDKANLFNFDMLKNTSVSSGTANYDNKTINIPSSNNLCVIGESFTGSPTAYEKFNNVINITEAGYYCLKFKVDSEVTNIEPRAQYGINIVGSETITVNPINGTFSDGYYFAKFEITDEIIELIQTSETYRMYFYAFRDKDTLENVDVTISEITFLKGNYSIDTMPGYGEYGKYRIPVKVTGANVARVNNGDLDNIYRLIHGIPVKKGQTITYIVNYTNNSSDTTHNISPRLYSDESLNTQIETYDSINSGEDVVQTITMNSDGYFTLCFGYGYSKVEFNKIFVGFGEYGIAHYEPYNEQTYNIILDEPLRKVGNYIDYIDFKNGQIVRNIEVLDNTGTLTIEESYQGLETSIIQSIELPDIQLSKGTNTITLDTEVEPSSISATYNAKQ